MSTARQIIASERWICLAGLIACVWYRLDDWHLFVQAIGIIVGGSIFFAWVIHLQLRGDK
jgi:hypothetical protein